MSGMTTTISANTGNLVTTSAGNTIDIETALTDQLDNTGGTVTLVSSANAELDDTINNTDGTIVLQSSTGIQTNTDLANQGGYITVASSGTISANASDEEAINNSNSGTITINGGALSDVGGFDNSNGGQLNLNGTGTIQGNFNNTDGTLSLNIGSLNVVENFLGADGIIDFNAGGNNTLNAASPPSTTTNITNLGVLEGFSQSTDIISFGQMSGNTTSITSVGDGVYEIINNSAEVGLFTLTSGEAAITTSANGLFEIEGGIGTPFALDHNNTTIIASETVSSISEETIGNTIGLAANTTLTVQAPGGISNSQGDQISAQAGAKIIDQGTLDNSHGGVITLNNAQAIIQGAINNGNTGTINLTNGSTLTSTAGLNGAGGTIVFAGNNNDLNITAGQNLGTISGFTKDDEINLTGTHFSADDKIVNTNGVISIMDGSTTVATFSTIAGEGFAITRGANGDIEIICFLAGTHIATPDGEVEVQNLRAGDLVLTANGGAKPVRWVGRSTVSTRFADPLHAAPIRIMAGALGNNLPQRDLLVSPGHAMFINGILVQAGALINDRTIHRETMSEERFSYYHVELENHELIIAEGAACESFVDNVDRMNFENWADRDHATLSAPMAEMAYPRAKSARQVPLALRQQLDQHADTLLAPVANVA